MHKHQRHRSTKNKNGQCCANQCHTNKEASKFENASPTFIENTDKNTIGYFSGPQWGLDKKVSEQLTKTLQKEFEAMFTGVACFDGTFHCLAKKLFKEELD